MYFAAVLSAATEVAQRLNLSCRENDRLLSNRMYADSCRNLAKKLHRPRRSRRLVTNMISSSTYMYFAKLPCDTYFGLKNVLSYFREYL